MSNYQSTKVIELGSCAFRQWGADHSHCHFLHGYQLKAKFKFGGSELDNKNWLVDFGGLKDLKAVLQDMFDHRLMIAENDPCLDLFKELEKRDACVLRIMPKGVGIERAAELCFNIASDMIAEKYGDRCWVDEVEVFEHENNSAVYTKTDPTQKEDETEDETEEDEGFIDWYKLYETMRTPQSPTVRPPRWVDKHGPAYLD